MHPLESERVADIVFVVWCPVPRYRNAGGIIKTFSPFKFVRWNISLVFRGARSQTAFRPRTPGAILDSLRAGSWPLRPARAHQS